MMSVWTADCQVFWWVAKCRSTTRCVGLDSSWILQNISVRRGGIEKDVSEVLLAGVTFARFFSATLCILEYLWAVSTVPIDLEGLLAKKPNKGTRVHTIPLCYLLLRAICHY